MDMKAYCALLPESVEQVGKGAFLTVGGEPCNPMTIGWAQFGVIWGKPMVTVLVRQSRYTHALLQKTDVFSVSVPALGDMQAALAYCGSHSGRDGDKLAATGLVRLPARFGGADGVAACRAHFECRIVYRQDMALEALDEAARTRFYGADQATPDGDPHTFIIGEVLGAYEE